MSAADGLGEYLLPILAVIGSGAVAISVFLATRNRRIFEDFLKPEKKTETKEAEKKTVEEKAATPDKRVEPSLIIEDVEKIKNELRLMDFEKEVTGYALTRLYEAEAEGKITEKDRAQLLGRYRDEMQRLDKEIEKKQMIVKLHELEETKANLVEMFNSKLDEISRNIENIKATLGIQPTEPTQVKTQPPQQPKTPPTKAKEGVERAAPRARVKSKTEERIEAVQEEVLKVLERLEQIETEERGESGELSGRGEEESGDSVG